MAKVKSSEEAQVEKLNQLTKLATLGMLNFIKFIIKYSLYTDSPMEAKRNIKLVKKKVIRIHA